MITLITGLPGASKTLYTLTIVDLVAKRDNRPVFYSGISGLTLPNWTEIEAEQWYNCPPNSIIVIDECQRVFRPRTISKDVPAYVSELETHRHKGLDLYMITQHPMLADTALRRLSGKHFHVVRKFGMQKSTVHEWAGVKDNCDKTAGRTDSIKHHWSFNKAMYPFYKSAEVHTVKANIPMRVKLLILLPFVLLALGYGLYSSMQKKLHPAGVVPSAPLMVNGQPVQANAGIDKTYKYVNAKQDAQEFIYQTTPRVAQLPMTAPKYDEVTKPTLAPVPVACVAGADKCTCYSQQATKMDVSKALCLQIVEQGFFREFEDKRERTSEVQRSDMQRVSYSPSDSARPYPNHQDGFEPVSVDQPMSRVRRSPQSPPVAPVAKKEPNTYGVVASRRDGVRVPE